MQLADKIITYETEETTPEFILDLFSELISTGLAWSLQGSYGRAAKRLIEEGYISPSGEIDQDKVRLTLEGGYE